MPNWVFNTVSISGNPTDLGKLQGQLNRPVETRFPKHEYNQETKTWENTPDVQRHNNPTFSFYNVVAPTDLDSYYNKETFTPLSEGESIGEKIAREMKIGQDWYHWNIRNWGTKWDIANADTRDSFHETTIELLEGAIQYRFQTAWSPVYEIFNILAEQYPALTFTYYYEEEQGWGGEVVWKNGEMTFDNQYDIPNSHAEHEERDRTCVCEWYDDPEDWYLDCPKVDEKEMVGA